ncbi:uncharacterized protein TRUGW13939_11272 [Talaromyces rugulosus]|uniref:Aminotransferase class V domain-containing protein n=1 Tax=Talaromyces rugulosus TaxID=121627 RepID=A0A7H8RCA4_TALRU|nr:uncharacterized protein TRUGW13939_11272 [Talaromyces rugulosus]QKX64099.1 hypothetical protein TRUGW13939_11272 [Talaromyces rugulosus]
MSRADFEKLPSGPIRVPRTDKYKWTTAASSLARSSTPIKRCLSPAGVQPFGCRSSGLDHVTGLDRAPDFAAVSFYKIFGFPDLGGLIVRKKSAQVLLQRPYFGGGTVEMATCSDQPWHSRKVASIHEALEDAVYLPGTRFTSYNPSHCTPLRAPLFYAPPERLERSIIAFNIRSDEGRWLGLSHIEKSANEHRIHLRTGTVCNPGGLAKILNLEQWELFQNYTAGVRCGYRSVLIGNKPSGIIRVSLGAMSAISDVEIFVGFVQDLSAAGTLPLLISAPLPSPQSLIVHTMMV